MPASASRSSWEANRPAVTTTVSMSPSAWRAASRAAAKVPRSSRSQWAVPTAARRAEDLQLGGAALASRRGRGRAGRADRRAPPCGAPGHAPFPWSHREDGVHGRLPTGRSRPVSHQAVHGRSPKTRTDWALTRSALRVPLAPHRQPGVEARLHGAEVLGAREGVLGEVDAAALGDHEVVQRVDEALRVAVAPGCRARRRCRAWETRSCPCPPGRNP